MAGERKGRDKTDETKFEAGWLPRLHYACLGPPPANNRLRAQSSGLALRCWRERDEDDIVQDDSTAMNAGHQSARRLAASNGMAHK